MPFLRSFSSETPVILVINLTVILIMGFLTIFSKSHFFDSGFQDHIIDLVLWVRCKILNVIVPSFRLWPWNVCLPINESFWAEYMNRFLVLFLTIPRLNRCFNHFETISVENNNLGWIWAIFPKGEKWDFSIPTHYRLPFSFMTTLPLSDNISINRES